MRLPIPVTGLLNRLALEDDAEKMKTSSENACECIKLMVEDKTDEAMNKYNS